ncbi:MAG: hypothetical protein AB7O56_10780 [Bauldia sp.]
MFYHDIVLFFHLIGLAMGLGIGIANILIARTAMGAATPDAASALRGLQPILARVSMIGLVILIISGLLLLFNRGFSGLSFWFWVKAVAVLGLIFIAYLMFQAQQAIRAGGPPPPQMRMYGPAMGLLTLLIVLFSVFAFH